MNGNVTWKLQKDLEWAIESKKCLLEQAVRPGVGERFAETCLRKASEWEALEASIRSALTHGA